MSSGNCLDLFSGIGGISLALQRCRGVRCAAYVEVDPTAQRVLRARMAANDLQSAPVHPDVRGVRHDRDVPLDIVCGGFPCQDISAAGKQQGLDGKRSCLVFEMLRLLGESGARWFFAENVAHFKTNGFATVKARLEGMGYEVRHVVVGADQCGLPHRRNRMFVLARRRASRRADIGVPRALPAATAEPGPRTVQSKGPDWFSRIHGLGNACSPVQCVAALLRLLGNPPAGETWDGAWDASDGPGAPGERSSTASHCPTPIASDAKGGAGPNRRNERGRYTSFSLSRWVKVFPSPGSWGLSATEEEYKGRLRRNAHLSPEWTEWVMGFPKGWSVAADAPP